MPNIVNWTKFAYNLRAIIIPITFIYLELILFKYLLFSYPSFAPITIGIKDGQAEKDGHLVKLMENKQI
jgi:hypothetical protein